eukprot:7389174-Prymnesium_polylepis.1
MSSRGSILRARRLRRSTRRPTSAGWRSAPNRDLGCSCSSAHTRRATGRCSLLAVQVAAALVAAAVVAAAAVRAKMARVPRARPSQTGPAA